MKEEILRKTNDLVQGEEYLKIKVQHYLISIWHCFTPSTMMNGHPIFLSRKINRIVRYRGRNVCSVCIVIREWNSITERAFVAICAIFKCNWRYKYRWSARFDNKKLFYFYFDWVVWDGWRYVNFYYDGLFATITKTLETFFRRRNADKNLFFSTRKINY